MTRIREKPPPALERRVLSFIQEHRLVSHHQTLLVAVSGGPDSVCLLHILVRLQEELGMRLHVAYLDHQLRGAEAEADAQYVSDLAHSLGIPATIEKREVKAYQAEQRISLEEAAREVRYTFLAEVAGAIGASRVAVGHTTDDHIETILMHLIRGTGTTGLCGLLPSTEWQLRQDRLTIIRPLLPVRREETAGYCLSHGLKPRMDTSNLSLSLLRNRIRHQLLPLLRSYNPRIVDALLRTGRIATDDLAVINRKVARDWSEIAQTQGDTIIFDKKGFLELPAALQRYLLRAAIAKLLGSVKDIEMGHIEAIIESLTKPAGKRLILPGGLVFAIDYDRLLLGADPAALSPFPDLIGEFPLTVPGETLLPGWRITANIMNRSQMTETKNEFTACFDLSKTGDKLSVRSRQRGDRFQPLGMSQPKKLGVFMIDAKIPRVWRQRVPVVCSPRHILWVVGWRIDDRVKVTPNTERVLSLQFERG